MWNITSLSTFWTEDPLNNPIYFIFFIDFYLVLLSRSVTYYEKVDDNGGGKGKARGFTAFNASLFTSLARAPQEQSLE